MYLPSAPTDLEKYAYIKQSRLAFYGFGIFSFLILTAGMATFVIQQPAFYVYGLFVAFLFVYLSISYLIGVFGGSFDRLKHFKVLFEGGEFEPNVDVFLPSCGEPFEVLDNAFKHIAALDYPNFKVYCLDDKGRTGVELLAAKYGFTYWSRPDKGELKKAGNLRFAFAQTSGEFFLVLDADFTPREDMLREIMPYFAGNDRLAIVQTPQYFELTPDQNWLQKGAAYIQELFYRMIQTNRDRWGGSICVGTNAVYRRVALEPFGGTAAIEHSEDVHTGFNCISTGWAIKYIPLNLAKGLCPDVLQSFFMQQYRWCTGSMTLFWSRRFWEAKISPWTRVCYMSGMFYYMATAAGIFLTPVPGLVVVWLYPGSVHWYNLLFAVPSFFFSVVYVAMWTKAPFGWYGISTRLISYWAHAFAIFDKVTGSTAAWVPTGAVAKKGAKYRTFLVLYHIWNAAIYLGIMTQVDFSNYDYYPIVFFSTFNYLLEMHILVPLRSKE
jgi:cellulose synthase/poly-beta-1,6-N-acetylglucosamine synthase-like glycosyltransferase